MILGANATVSIYPITHGASTSTYGAASVTGVEAYIESVRAEVLQVLDQAPNIEVFQMSVEPLTIKIGDKVIDQDSTEYRVTGVERHENNTDTDDIYTVTMHKEHQ